MKVRVYSKEEGLKDVCPVRFTLGGREIQVQRLIDRWPGEDHEYVKILTMNGQVYILRLDLNSREWEVVLFSNSSKPEIQKPLPYRGLH